MTWHFLSKQYVLDGTHHAIMARRPSSLLYAALVITAALGATIDVSYLHHVPASRIAESIQAAMRSHSDEVRVDVSSCALRNEGFRIIVDAMVEIDPKQINLLSRMNQISSDGIASVLGGLLDIDLKNVSGTHTSRFAELDLGWNHFSDCSDNPNFLKTLRRLIESSSCCPSVLRLDACGIDASVCRSIAKGLVNRYEAESPVTTPLSLFLCLNQGVGDAGVAAIAAAIRTIALSEKKTGVVFDTLSLSGCSITDAGATALAHALESSPEALVNHLDLSNNKIGEDGATAIGRALSNSVDNRGPRLLTLELSGNANINDRGVIDIATAMGNGFLPKVILRTCNIQADGATAFGRCLRKFLLSSLEERSVYLDLSGNPLGVLRGKPKDQGKYSASRLKSKATATAASYFGMFKKGLKDVGVDFGSTLESDDEDEKDEDDGAKNPAECLHSQRAS